MLRSDTEAVWRFLERQPALSGFVLTGGSALALRLGHRRSDDLDLAWPGPRLPRERLDVMARVASEAGMRWEAHDNPAAVREFADGGLDLMDYQQDYLVGAGVKVTFFAPERATLGVLDPLPKESGTGPRLASLAELFRTKALLTARRSRTRDSFDLQVLITRCGFGLDDYHDAFARGGIADQAATGLVRLCTPTAVAADPGYEAVAPGAPSIEELARFFGLQRDAFERSEAARAWRNRVR